MLQITYSTSQPKKALPTPAFTFAPNPVVQNVAQNVAQNVQNSATASLSLKSVMHSFDTFSMNNHGDSIFFDPLPNANRPAEPLFAATSSPLPHVHHRRVTTFDLKNGFNPFVTPSSLFSNEKENNFFLKRMPRSILKRSALHQVVERTEKRKRCSTNMIRKKIDFNPRKSKKVRFAKIVLE